MLKKLKNLKNLKVTILFKKKFNKFYNKKIYGVENNSAFVYEESLEVIKKFYLRFHNTDFQKFYAKHQKQKQPFWKMDFVLSQREEKEKLLVLAYLLVQVVEMKIQKIMELLIFLNTCTLR
jgi:hypothetical protein